MNVDPEGEYTLFGVNGPLSLMSDGGRLIGEGVGRGGAFFASTRMTGLGFMAGLGESSVVNSLARGDG